MRRFIVLIQAILLSYSLSSIALESEPKSATASIVSLKQTDCQFSGTFEQTKRLKELDEGLTSKGVFYHHCQHGVIWSSIEPLQETLVMRRDGKGFVITDNTTKQLKNRQGKFLSNLLNALMSGDQAAIEKQFEISISDDKVISLTPKKRSLKRAIKLIQIKHSKNKQNVQISMLDRNSLQTQINSKQIHIFNDERLLKNCQLALSLDAHVSAQNNAVSPNNVLNSTDSCELLLKVSSAQTNK